MPEIPSLGWQEIARIFSRLGWQHDRTRGSHYIMVRMELPGLLSIPMHNPVKRGTLRKLIREAGVTPEAFLNTLRDT